MDSQLLKDLYELRGIEEPCRTCSGFGVRGYANTSTWMHGIGGQAITRDICDKCWGSGDSNRTWTDLRKLNSQIRLLKAERDKAYMGGLEQACKAICYYCRSHGIPVEIGHMLWAHDCGACKAGAIRHLMKEVHATTG